VASKNRAAAVTLMAILGFAIPAAWIVMRDSDPLSGFLEAVFGGTSLVVGTSLGLATLAWIVSSPDSRRRNAGLLGVLLGLAVGFEVIAWLVYSSWSLARAEYKIAAMFGALPIGSVIGFAIGHIFARGAPVPRRPLQGPRYHP
jgi:hypothetical protein